MNIFEANISKHKLNHTVSSKIRKAITRMCGQAWSVLVTPFSNPLIISYFLLQFIFLIAPPALSDANLGLPFLSSPMGPSLLILVSPSLCFSFFFSLHAPASLFKIEALNFFNIFNLFGSLIVQIYNPSHHFIEDLLK